jgi:hypothetical protein
MKIVRLKKGYRIRLSDSEFKAISHLVTWKAWTRPMTPSVTWVAPLSQSHGSRLLGCR